MIVSSFVWTQYRIVTGRQTDRQNRSGYYSALHCEQRGRAVKIDIETTDMIRFYVLISNRYIDIHRVRKKGATLFLPVTPRNANRFSKFFYRHALQ